MSVLAQVIDGQWALVEELDETPEGAICALLGEDVAPVFELDEPTPVIALRPELPGAPSALCTTAAGDVVAVVAVGPESSAATRDRLFEVVDGLCGLSLVELMSLCDRIGLQHTPGSWVVARVGSGDPVQIDRAIEERLSSGAITVLVVTRSGYGHVALPIAELRAGRPVNVRCMDLRHLAAGPVHIVEAYEVSRSELDAAASAAEHRANTDELYVSARRTLGAGVLPLYDAMLRHCEAFFDEVSFRGVGELVIVEAWLDNAERRTVAMSLDSTGAVSVDLSWLESWDRTFLLQAIHGIVDDELWSEAEPYPQELHLSLPLHLGDVSLVEQFVGALSDSFLSTICNSMAPGDARRMAA